MKLRNRNLKPHQEHTTSSAQKPQISSVVRKMLKPFVCANFQHEEDEDEILKSLPTTPKKSKKSSKNNNPYSDRGLDKFSALVADLEQKKRKIYSQIGSDDISLVRFVYSNNSNDVVPIVVRLKENKQDKLNKTGEGKHGVKDKANDPVVDKLQIETSTENETTKQSTAVITEGKKKLVSWNLKLHQWRRPSYYMPVFIVLIMILLVFVGRSVAVLCTSIGWYLLPTLSSEKPTKKKVYLRRHSEIRTRINGASPPRNSNIVNGKEKWHSNDGHRKSF